jgi:phenylacetate-CoA ligase
MRPRSTDLPLDPIETASRDAIQALQLERLKHSLAHAYENVAAYRAKFDAAGVPTAGCRSDAMYARIA